MLAHIARHPHLRVHPSPRSPVEVHKTFDHANYHKSADIGQMLIVYEDEYAMEEAKNERGYRVDLPVVLPLGVDPPHEEGGAASIPVEVRGARREARPAAEVGRVLVERELVEMMSKLSTGKGKPKRMGGKGREMTEVEEEVVDYEPRMGEGGGSPWTTSRCTEMKHIEAGARRRRREGARGGEEEGREEEEEEGEEGAQEEEAGGAGGDRCGGTEGRGQGGDGRHHHGRARDGRPVTGRRHDFENDNIANLL